MVGKIRTKKTEDLSTMPTTIRKHHTPEQKAQVVIELLKEKKTLSQLASE